MPLGWPAFQKLRRFGQGAQDPEVVRLAEHVERLEQNLDLILSELPNRAEHQLVPRGAPLTAAGNPHYVQEQELVLIDGVDGDVDVVVPASTAANLGARIRFHLYNSPDGELEILEPNGTLLNTGENELEFPTSVELTSCYPCGWQCQAFLDVPADGSFYIDQTATAATSIGVANTWYKAAGTTLQVHGDNFSMPADNRLQCTCPIATEYKLTGTISCTSAGNNKKYEFGIGINGTIRPESQIIRKIASGSDEGAIPVQSIEHMADGDYAELFVRNLTDTTNITFTTGNLAIVNAY